MHSILRRQLARAGLSPERPPDAERWAAFLASVDASYQGHDQDRYLLERAMTLSSEEMRLLHQALRRDRERLAAVLHSLDVGLIVLDDRLHVGMANPEAARMLGVSMTELLGWTSAELDGCAEADAGLQELLAELYQGLSGGVSLRRSLAEDAFLRTPDGRQLPVAVSVVPVLHDNRMHAGVLLLRDTSDRHELELELRQAQKLEAVGRLAAGVAHELNTPIQFVGDNLSFVSTAIDGLLGVLAVSRRLAATTPASPRDGRELLEELRTALASSDSDFVAEELPQALSQTLAGVKRVTTIVAAMKSFSHPGVAKPAVADLNLAIEEAVTVARGEFKDVADVELQLSPLPPVTCFIHDLKQVFLNLVVNASHAIVERIQERPGRGRIRIGTSCEGDQIRITVHDDGVGIPDAEAEHVFEPFFTTKEPGRGTGQGLAMAHRIVVDMHGGKLGFHSVVGEGTTFEILLPVSGL